LKRQGEQSQANVQEEIPFNDRCGRWWPDGKLKYDDLPCNLFALGDQSWRGDRPF
jgi:hypothetical protein